MEVIRVDKDKPFKHEAGKSYMYNAKTDEYSVLKWPEKQDFNDYCEKVQLKVEKILGYRRVKNDHRP
jgi:hypothetical protein